ncbi:MAG: glycerol acyltransferase [Bacteroidetes bacterium 4572_117]|nr:MAG: glycerol acyltransferase [Bacteroidetes bacterium 4572_117]
MEKAANKNKLFIDTDDIIIKKNQRLYNLIPSFIINYIKRIVHQDELNYIIETYKDYQGLDFNKVVLDDYFGIKTTAIGQENIPKHGRYILAANHPIGGIDGMLFMQEAGKIFGPTKSIINDILLNIKNLTPLFVGVNKHGSTSREVFEAIDKTFLSDEQILIFPAGLASRKSNGKIRDLEWKKTVISKAIKYKRDVIPVHISGKLSNFFYNFARLRNLLGIKYNLEMFYLADETFKQKNKSFEVTFGKPISHKTFDKTFSHYDWAQKVKNHVYLLNNNPSEDFKQ